MWNITQAKDATNQVGNLTKFAAHNSGTKMADSIQSCVCEDPRNRDIGQ